MNFTKVTVITVCFNAIDTIERTILSVLNQTYNNIEYIIIDGGSTDGTLDIIKLYQDRINYWISEPDNGIYDAMNKGIYIATGDYINFMNSGDLFYDTTTIEKVFKHPLNSGIIYGDSFCCDNDKLTMWKSHSKTSLLKKHPIYRHGASFVKTSIYRKIPFNLAKTKKFKYALDFNQIFHMYMAGYDFYKVDLPLILYEKKGISDSELRNLIYNTRIINQYNSNLKYIQSLIISLSKFFIIKILNRTTKIN